MATSKATISRLRRIVDYLDATKNEIAVDEEMLRISGLEAKQVGYIPRVPKWGAYAKRSPSLIRNIARILYLFWVLGLGTALMFLQFAPRWLRAPRSISIPPATGYVLAFSVRVGDIIDSKTFPNLPKTWITVPWAPLQRSPAGTQLVDLYSLLFKRDLVCALMDAILAQRRLLRRASTRKWALQGYTAFKWFAVRAAVDKLTGSLVMADHFDRWAVLVDRSAREPRRHLTLIQHGTVADLDCTGKASPLLANLHAKLKNVSQLYAYGPLDELIFKMHIIDVQNNFRELAVAHYSPHIELRKSTTKSPLSILFVGHSLCEKIQSEVFKKLQDHIEFSAYYKPHPLAPMSADMTTIGWHIITDPSHFPNVNLVIAYPSTLVIEYGALDIPAVVHPLNADSDQCNTIVQEILGRISGLPPLIK